MKQLWRTLLPLLAGAALMLGACTGRDIVDADYPWPASGVPEADSLLLAFEHLREDALPRTAPQRRAIAARICEIAGERPENKILSMRRLYMSTCTLLTVNPRRAYSHLIDGMAEVDSAASPYDFHALMALRLPYEKSIYTKYMIAASNVEFFDARSSEVELARNLVLKGNVLTKLSDTAGALAAYERARSLFMRHGMRAGESAVRLNSLPLHQPRRAWEILQDLLADSLVMDSPKLSVPVLQTAYYFTDSTALLDRAIALASTPGVDSSVLPILLAMKACDLVRRGDSAAALDMTEEIRRAERVHGPATRYRPVIHNNLAMVYEANGMADSCISQLVQAADWTDSLQRESSHSRVYANEARMLIDAAGRNARLERRNLLMGCLLTLVLIAGTALALYTRHHRKTREIRSQLRLLDEQIERERRLNFAQASILEQSESMISRLQSALEASARGEHPSPETHNELQAQLASYRSNEEGRQGLLKVSREVDTAFSSRLKHDYPALSESQLRLAALIAAGVDSAQIAAILNISARSLYTSRYRLRARLKLPKTTPLEPFLRTYATTPSNHPEYNL